MSKTRRSFWSDGRRIQPIADFNIYFSGKYPVLGTSERCSKERLVDSDACVDIEIRQARTGRVANCDVNIGWSCQSRFMRSTTQAGRLALVYVCAYLKTLHLRLRSKNRGSIQSLGVNLCSLRTNHIIPATVIHQSLPAFALNLTGAHGHHNTYLTKLWAQASCFWSFFLYYLSH